MSARSFPWWVSVCAVACSAVATETVGRPSHDDGLIRLQTIVGQSRPPSPVEVPEGWFLMGSEQHPPMSGFQTPFDNTEIPQRRIWLDAYEIDREEVSVANFLAWVLDHRGGHPDDLRWLQDTALEDAVVAAQRPVVWVSWSEAEQYCRSAGKRLPTEAEWEKAARGNDGRLFPWGDDPPDQHRAVFGRSGAGGPVSVRDTAWSEAGRSFYGAFHMAGNAAEWVADWSGIDWYRVMPERNPQGPPDGRYRVVRGGSWRSEPVMLRAATRGAARPEARSDAIGFRCARSTRDGGTP